MWANVNIAASTSNGFLNDARDLNNGNKKIARRIVKIIPVVIQQIKSFNNDSQNHVFSFIGIVNYIERNNNKITYEIEDDTDHIKSFKWLETGKISEPLINLNTYVRIYGHLREQNEKKYILILRIWPLIHLNELTNHLLEVTYVILKSQKMLNKQNKKSNTDNAFMIDDNCIGLTKEQSIIFNIIQAKNDSENGIERNVIKTCVPKNIDVDNIINFLINEGHIYSTLTDNHFKTT